MINDESLAGAVTEAERSWWKVTRPVASRTAEQIESLDLNGLRVAIFQHVLLDSGITFPALVRAGARVKLAAVNPDSTDDVAAAYLVKQGVEVWAWAGMTEPDRLAGLKWLLEEPADAISDMGGELITASIEGGFRPQGGLEATTSGLHRLAGLTIPFPVFNWNDAALKDRLHNRHHVGFEVWPVFSAITGIALHGRSVLVIGFGPVGRGVAIRARELGGVVSVVEVDPVRALEAQHHGCRDVSLEEGLAACSIIVTATGREFVLGEDQLRRVRDGAVVFNVGHSNREIDIDWLDHLPHEGVRRHVERYEVDGKHLFLLNRGSLVNIAPGTGAGIQELFDPFTAMIVKGIAWILTGGAAAAPPGLQPYPAHLEREIADMARAARR
jgi:adenosylhomocysteinase